MSHRKTHEEFVRDAEKIHGIRYDYSQVIYVSNKHKVKIRCLEHGIFKQKPNTHLDPKKIHGCPKCGRIKCADKRKLGKELFIIMAKKINPYYDYSKVEYVQNKVKVLIGCSIHGYFSTSPNQFLRSKDGCCPGCGKEKASKALSLSQEEFLERSAKVHKNKFDYSLTVYRGKDSSVKIICPIHGLFEQNAGNHLYNEEGCKKCASEEEGRRKRALIEAVLLDRFKKVHGDTYDYSRVIYKGATEKIEIICEEHGPFWQSSISHQKGSICPLCSPAKGAKKAAETMATRMINGKSVKQLRTEKTARTKSKIGEDGLDGYERSFLHGAGRNCSIKYYDKNLYYQGTYEKNFLDFMKKNNELNNIKRGRRFYYSYKDKRKQYRSDFLFNNINIEIKSSWTYSTKDEERRLLSHLKFRSVLDEGQRLIAVFDKKFFIEVTYDNIDKNLYEEKFKSIDELIDTLRKD